MLTRPTTRITLGACRDGHVVVVVVVIIIIVGGGAGQVAPPTIGVGGGGVTVADRRHLNFNTSRSF